MTSKKMGSKLADSLRQMRGEKPVVPPPKTPAREAPPPSPAAPAMSATQRPRAPSERAAGFARQSDQSPPASLDRPWENLHPVRIWPD